MKNPALCIANNMGGDEQRCWDCKENKPFAAFAKDRTRGNGHCPRCRVCISIQAKKRRSQNPEKTKADSLRWYYANREQALATAKDWQRKNPESGRTAAREWARRNREVARAKYNEWYAANKDSQLERWRVARSERRIADPIYRLMNLLRSEVRGALIRNGKERDGRSLRRLGYSTSALCEHIENHFLSGMSWDNYGEWHIDHCRPIASFNLADYASIDDLILECFALSNLQPLWAKDNKAKQAIWNGRDWRKQWFTASVTAASVAK